MLPDFISVAQLTAKKRTRIVLFWYTHFMILLLAYWLLKKDGRGFDDIVEPLTIPSIIQFLVHGGAAVFAVCWVIATLCVANVLRYPLRLIGFIVASQTKHHWTKAALFFNVIARDPLKPTRYIQGKRYRFADAILDEDGMSRLDRDVVRSLDRELSALLATSLVMTLYGLDSPVSNWLVPFLWIATAYLFINSAFAHYVKYFFRYNVNEIRRIPSYQNVYLFNHHMDLTFPKKLHVTYEVEGKG